MSDLRYEWCLLHPRAVRTAVASCLPRAARGGLPPGTFLRCAKVPVPHTPTPLLLSPGSFFGLGAGQLQDQQACGVQPNNRYKKKESYDRDIFLCY